MFLPLMSDTGLILNATFTLDDSAGAEDLGFYCGYWVEGGVDFGSAVRNLTFPNGLWWVGRIVHNKNGSGSTDFWLSSNTGELDALGQNGVFDKCIINGVAVDSSDAYSSGAGFTSGLYYRNWAWVGDPGSLHALTIGQTFDVLLTRP